ncbi:hypothetical protein PCC7424_1631 [Gloeothece citriformis PCC 7424]|uniref:Uncharacterized protein n=1 Tax=Gloeothece citriformis (strain PCC 7424) TaxID=65393 RepID=B7KAW0_GLOC7|nr:hypothetical protein [Gloeothece citriformis]ACK70070.1 hypothetical protein PCC7424_1631 [Gloeothece citriformis PCC 7424]
MFHSPSSGSSQAFFDRLESLATPAGYVAPAVFQSKDKEYMTRLKSLAAKALSDPLLQRDLCDRVYELMLEDLRLQKENIRHYGGLL